ncbi:MAG: hypothetical protein ACPG8V_04900 [Alphaproteobacteria bacterium]
MSFNINNLSVLAYANGFTLWHLKSSDNMADVDTAGYLNEANEMIRIGDIIIVSASDKTGFVTVSANASGVVDVNNALEITATDTD